MTLKNTIAMTDTAPVSLFTNKIFEILIATSISKSEVLDLKVMCEGLCKLGFKITVLPKGDQTWDQACHELSSSFLDAFNLLERLPANEDLALKTSQLIFFGKEIDQRLLEKSKKKGIICALPWSTCEMIPSLMNFDAQQESGNCFLYTPEHSWDMVATMVRAFENYKFSYDWNQLKKRWKDTKLA